MSAANTLRSRGLRATPKRLLLLTKLQHAHTPLRAEELHAQLRNIDLVTVYRNLQDFVRAGLAHEVRFKDASVRYELFHGHHHHIVCTRCGTVEELDGCDNVPLESEAIQASSKFARIEEHALEFFGLCKGCV